MGSRVIGSQGWVGSRALFWHLQSGALSTAMRNTILASLLVSRHILVANLNSNRAGQAGEGYVANYTIRATCLPPADELPCHRPDPTKGSCSNPLGSPEGTRGVCELQVRHGLLVESVLVGVV